MKMDNITAILTRISSQNLSQNALKAILLIILFVCTFLASTASFIFRRLPNQQGTNSFRRIFSLFSCFGAGVFLATCMLDLLPDSMEYIQRAEKRIGYEIKFPLAAFCITAGFLLVLFLEQAIIFANKHGWIENIFQVQSALVRHHHNDQEESTETEFEQGSLQPETEMNLFRALLLVFALSLHAVFEGLSIGMISDVPVLLQIFISLLIHKTIVGFSLGVRLIQSKLRSTTIVICCVIFAGQILIGGFSGLAIIDILHGNSSIFIVSGILQAIACGTFLYVTTFEILPHELDNDSHIPEKMLAIFCGFSLIAIFIAIFPDVEVN